MTEGNNNASIHTLNMDPAPTVSDERVADLGVAVTGGLVAQQSGGRSPGLHQQLEGPVDASRTSAVVEAAPAEPAVVSVDQYTVRGDL